jgi:hypothetical protein
MVSSFAAPARYVFPAWGAVQGRGLNVCVGERSTSLR